MGWFVRMDNFQSHHIVYAQENQNSCGMACIRMVVFKVNKLVPNKGAIHTEKQIYKAYSDASNTNYNGSAYSDAIFFPKVLNKLNCGSWKCEYYTDVSSQIIKSVGTDYVGFGTVGDVVNTVRRGSPVILLVSWSTSGAHFVVIDTVYNLAGVLYAAVCDPWDGNIHLTRFEAGKPFNYVGKTIPFSLDVGSGTRNNYSSPSTGSGNGWLVHQV